MLADGWTPTRLGDVLEESRLEGTDGSQARKLTVKLYGKGVVKKNEKLVGSESTRYYRRRAGQFIYSRLDFLNGAFGVVPDELDGFETTLDLPAFDVDGSRLEARWLAAYVARPSFYATKGGLAKGGRKARRVSPEELLEEEIHLPPLDAQRRHLEIADCAFAAVEAAEAVVVQTEKVMRGVMEQLLTRGLPGKHKRFIATEIGELPHGWTVQPLEALADVNRGKFSHRPRNEPRLYGGATPFVQTGDVAGSHGWHLGAHEQTLSDEGVSFSRVFPAGSLLVTIAANIGRVALTKYPVACPDSLVAVQPRRAADAYWLLAELHRRQPDLERCAPQNAQKNINLEVLRPLQVPVPPEDEREMIGSRYGEFQEAISIAAKAAKQARVVALGLVHDLVSGRVRVPT